MHLSYLACLLCFTTLIVVSAAQTNYSIVNAMFGEVHVGGASWKGSTNGGACNILAPFPTGVIPVAINTNRWYNSETCGMCAQIFYPVNDFSNGTYVNNQVTPGSPYIVYVVDKYRSQIFGTGFDILTDTVIGGDWGINWTAVECPFTSDNISYSFSSLDVNNILIQVRHNILPVDSISIQFPDGPTVVGTRKANNFFSFDSTPATITYPFNLNITAVNGEKITDTIAAASLNVVVQGTGTQFGRVVNPSPSASPAMSLVPDASASEEGSSGSSTLYSFFSFFFIEK
eukprot:TRINITY_DN1494_c0_g1_i1.p1 TRINITY_DN1494_c0_g1~~TRINITY_DN1494_c0_g1_i1.p1  ORF type:complete len:287 (+),score=41.52 TRINITY_DN1494_c0_g1_i1:33-893(+)